MKIKKFFALLLSLCMVMGLWACAENAPATEPTEISTESSITPLVYEVTDPEGNTIWIMGSIHVGYDYFYPLPDYAYQVYNEADTLAVEFDVVAFESDLSAQTEALTPMIYTDGSTISDYISQDLYDRAVQVLTDAGYYMEALDYYNVAMWSMLLDSLLIEELGVATGLGIDLHFLNKAHDDGKKIEDIESAQFQYGMMADYSMPLQLMLLESSLESWEDLELYRENLEELAACWASGDEAELVSLLAAESDELTEDERALYEEYNQAMITDRNIGMADFAEAALADGDQTLIVVGAAHVVGEGGMIDLLTRRGYTVNCLGGTPAAN